jgi:hypothetical protein
MFLRAVRLDAAAAAVVVAEIKSLLLPSPALVHLDRATTVGLGLSQAQVLRVAAVAEPVALAAMEQVRQAELAVQALPAQLLDHL